MGLFYDSTYLLVILAALISMAVSARMNTIFSKYQTVRSYSGMTGREAAMRILHQAGIYDVTVRHVSGKLTDHYDPRTKTVNLSDAVYDSTSVAAIGVAAHECGHAVQHNTDYVPLKVRSAIVPAANLRIPAFLAAVPDRTDFQPSDAGESRDLAVCAGTGIPGGNTSGRVRCVEKSIKNAQ